MAVSWEKIRHQVAISGQVTNFQTGKPIPKARIEITTAPQAFMEKVQLLKKLYIERWETMVERIDRKQTAADGHFHFLDLPAGSYTLTASLPDSGSRYGEVQKTVTIVVDSQGNITMVTADMALPPTTLKGQITDQNTTDPIAMAEARIKGSGERDFSDGQGNYLLNDLETGLRTVLVTAQGYNAVTQTILLDTAGGVKILDLSLT